MYMPINPLSYSCIKKLQRDNLWHAYNEPINFYSVIIHDMDPNSYLNNSRKKLLHYESKFFWAADFIWLCGLVFKLC